MKTVDIRVGEHLTLRAGPGGSILLLHSALKDPMEVPAAQLERFLRRLLRQLMLGEKA